MITINVEYEYIIRLDAYVKTKTSAKPLWLGMVYDPGSGTTTISEQIALNAGYKIKKAANNYIDGVGGRVKAGYTIIPDLIIGGVSLGPVYAHVVKFHNELAQHTGALLGMNVLSWFKITQECHWDDELNRFASATLLFEPKFDLNTQISYESFEPFDRGQRFGTAFVSDKPI